ncbi:alpha-amylase [Hortaea werneckii]|nr:alpha-amylase [Hortaea werneckii]KAI7447191.1 alpha-amylase [Hortaea werneckii]
MYSSSILASIAALSLALNPLQASAATADQWRGRSIYQVLTDRFARTDGSTSATCNTGEGLYCGGSFKGIQNHLDYIQGMGFDAIWISPITAQIEGTTAYGEAYHGYWQQDLYSINSHFGTSDDLKSLSQALHSRGMYLMVDVVYHTPYCPIDYSDLSDLENLHDCWIGDEKVPLPDLRTEDDDVRQGYQKWINGLVSEYGIDGLRLDTIIQVETGFWSGFQQAAGVYMIGEANAAGAKYVCDYQDYVPGVMNYGQYFPLVDAFKSTSGSISELANMVNSVKSECTDMSLVGSFSENHDQPRFASLNGDMALARNIITYTMLADGIPIIYEGQEQHYNALGGSNDPYNREAVWFSGYNTDAELYKLVTNLNKIRKQAISDDGSYLGYNAWPTYTGDHVLGMRKGKMTFVTSNLGSSSSDTTVTIGNTGFSGGAQVTDLISCNTMNANDDGSISVTISNGQSMAFYPSDSTGGLCGSGSDSGNDNSSDDSSDNSSSDDSGDDSSSDNSGDDSSSDDSQSTATYVVGPPISFTTFTTVPAPTRYADGTTTTVYATATATYDASSTTTTVDSKPWWHNNKRSETGFVKKIRAPAAQETSA